MLKQEKPVIKKPLRMKHWGKLIQYTGAILMVPGIGLIMMGGEQEITSAILAGIVLLGVGLLGYFNGIRLASSSAEALLQQDPRAPIVFVRSFRDEQGDKNVGGFLRSLQTAFKIAGRSGSTNTISTWGPTFQWQLNKLLREVGPYVAIGRPGEQLAGMGAARMYVADDEWQAVISELFGESRLIIMRMGKTPGLRWELKQLRLHIDPCKLLFILPHKPADYEAFRQWANKELPKPMPEAMPTSRFMVLDDDWNPRELEWRNWLLDTLEPYLNRNGVTRKDISLSYKMTSNSPLFAVFVSILLVLVGIIVAGWFLG